MLLFFHVLLYSSRPHFPGTPESNTDTRLQIVHYVLQYTGFTKAFFHFKLCCFTVHVDMYCCWELIKNTFTVFTWYPRQLYLGCVHTNRVESSRVESNPVQSDSRVKGCSHRPSRVQSSLRKSQWVFSTL